MADYDFSTLSDVEFERLVRDLLQAEWRMFLESFKPGRDQGIDLRYSSNPNQTVVVQCKHWFRSGLRALVRELRSEELPKIQRLTPTRYVLVTSVPLSPANKNELLTVLSPWCKSTSDIFGRDDLNNLLGIHSDVERRHHKLWLSSVDVLERVLHADAINVSEWIMGDIQKKLPRYVQIPAFLEALEILERENYCLITGIPGIGKSTLAEMILLDHMRRGWEAVGVTNITDAAKLYKPERQQIFYYDDFLGQTCLEHKLTDKEDSVLAKFISLVSQSKKHRLLLTTREYILDRGRRMSETLRRIPFDRAQCVVKLGQLSSAHRATMLYNHVYFSELDERYTNELLRDQSYFRVIRHRGFNPRIVEMMTFRVEDLGIEASAYIDDFLRNLTYPLEVWAHAFENQISEPAQEIILMLVSFGPLWSGLPLMTLRSCFEAGRTDRQSSDRALKELDGTFLKTDLDPFSVGKAELSVSFHNPSVRDFIECRLAEDEGMLRWVFQHACYVDQVTNSARRFIRQDSPESLLDAARDAALRVQGQYFRYRKTVGSVTVYLHGAPLFAELNEVFESLALHSRVHALSYLQSLSQAVSEWEVDLSEVDYLVQLTRSMDSAGIALTPALEEAIGKSALEAERIIMNGAANAEELIDAVNASVHLSRNGPSAVRIEMIRATLEESLEEVVEELEGYDDSFLIREYAGRLASIADSVGVDLAHEVATLDDTANRMDEDGQEDDEGVQASPKVESPKSADLQLDDKEIEHMFAALTTRADED